MSAATRTRLLCLTLTLFNGLASGQSVAGASPGEGRLCVKPEAPLAISLVTVSEHGEQLELAWEVSPVLPMRELSWELALWGTVRVESGEASGHVSAGEDDASGGVTSGGDTTRPARVDRPGTSPDSIRSVIPARRPAAGGVLSVRVPRDGAHKRLELVVTGVLAASGDSVVARAGVEWERPEAFAPRFDSRRVGDLAQASFALVPVRASPASRLPAQPASAAQAGAADESARESARESAGGVAGEVAAGAVGAGGTFLVIGEALYEDKGWKWSGWSGEDPLRPVRHAAVTVLDASTGAVLGAGPSGDDGRFSIECAASGLVDVQLRIDCDTRLDSSVQPQFVRDLSGATWALLSPVTVGHDTSAGLDVGTLTALKLQVGAGEANPFNILDVVVNAFAFITDPVVGADFAPDTIENVFPSGAGSFAYPDGAWIGDDDGYDDAVILHEIGHVVHAQYSHHSSPGSQHFFGDSDQDPRTSITEGFATFFNGMVLTWLGRSAIYVDANGSAQVNGAGLHMRLETVAPYQAGSYGAADEVAVACVLYDLFDTVDTFDGQPGVDDDAFDGSFSIGGLTTLHAFWEVFVGPMAEAPLLTHNDTWDGWLGHFGEAAQAQELTAVFELRKQRFVEDAAEPDDQLQQATLQPVVAQGGDYGPERTLYRVPDGGPGPGSLDFDWISHELVIGSVVRFETRYPGGVADADTQVDTVMQLFDPLNQPVAIDFDSGAGRNARVADVPIESSGTWRVLIAAQQPDRRRYGRYEYRASYLFENHAPQITGGPMALPPVVADDSSTELWVVALDPDEGHGALDYLWTPLDGGTVEGSGQGVTFVPPDVHDEALVRVAVVAIDPLGAESLPGVVEILVHAAGTSVCEGDASVVSGGDGKPGLAGVPRLAALGAPTLPSPGFGLRVGQALPGLAGFVVVGASPVAAPFDGGVLQPSPDLLLPVRAGSDGVALLGLPLPADPGACGLSIWAQALFPGDPGATGAKATAQSNWLELTLGG